MDINSFRNLNWSFKRQQILDNNEFCVQPIYHIKIAGANSYEWNYETCWIMFKNNN